MKELSIEQKARRYDEAIEMARKIENGEPINIPDGTHIPVAIFPELKENENKRFIQYFKDLSPFDKADELYEKYGFSHKDAIAWLEKQGEQKPIKIPKWMIEFLVECRKKLGCPMEYEEHMEMEGKIIAIEKFLEGNHNAEQKPLEWSEEDEKMLNDICIDIMEYVPKSFEENSKKVSWLKSLNPQPKQEWSEEDERIRIGLVYHLKKLREWEVGKIVPIKTNEYYDVWLAWLEKQGKQKTTVPLDENGEPILTSFEAVLFSTISRFWQSYNLGEEVNIAEFVKEYAPELLEAANKQEKVEWSEEDEKMLNRAIQLISPGNMHSDYAKYKQRIVDWLKSLHPWSNQEVDEQIETIAMHLDNCGNTAMAEILRSCNIHPQNTWKPSDEQMAALSDINITGCISYAGQGQELINLYNDLKKLKEE